MSRRLLVLTVAASLATPALAQQDAPPSAAEIAQAHATADRIIDAADARDFFTNQTTGALAEVRHTASGMRCTFSGGPQDRLMIFPSPVARGDDVSCVSRDEALGIDLNLYATRYPDRPSQDDVLGSTAMSIETRFPGARQYEGVLTAATFEGQSRPKSVAYHITLDGKPRLTLALVSNRDDWSFKARATGPDEEDAMMLSFYASLLFSGAIRHVEGQGETPKGEKSEL